MTSSAEIFIRNRRVLASGSIVIPQDKNAKIQVTDSGETVTFNFNFIAPQAGDIASPDIKFALVSAREAEFNMMNFDNPGGIGLVLPERVATLGEKPLFLSFLVHGVGDVRLFSYTFSVEEDQ